MAETFLEREARHVLASMCLPRNPSAASIPRPLRHEASTVSKPFPPDEMVSAVRAAARALREDLPPRLRAEGHYDVAAIRPMPEEPSLLVAHLVWMGPKEGR